MVYCRPIEEGDVLTTRAVLLSQGALRLRKGGSTQVTMQNTLFLKGKMLPASNVALSKTS